MLVSQLEMLAEWPTVLRRYAFVVFMQHPFGRACTKTVFSHCVSSGAQWQQQSRLCRKIPP
jgi:hypothetical protein